MYRWEFEEYFLLYMGVESSYFFFKKFQVRRILIRRTLLQNNLTSYHIFEFYLSEGNLKIVGKMFRCLHMYVISPIEVRFEMTDFCANFTKTVTP